MQIKLHIQGPEKDERLEITLRPGQVFTVGRKGCNLNLEDGKVSRRHLGISDHGGMILLEDLGSHNGTYFQEKRVTSREVSEGESFRIGAHHLTFALIHADHTTVKQERKSDQELLSLETELPPHQPAQGYPTSDDTPLPPLDKEDEPEASSPPLKGAEHEFRFYRNRKLDFEEIKNTYLYAVKNLQTFWQDTSYDIAFERSLPVLCLLSVILGFVSAMIHRDSLGIFSAVSIATAKIAFVIIVAALYSQLRGWLKGSGQFHEVVAFAVYWHFLHLPVAILTAWSAPASGLLGFAFFFWGVWGFWKVFNPSLMRLLALIMAIVISLLGIGGAVAFMAYSLFKLAAPT